MTPTFQAATFGTIEKVYSGALGEVSTSTRDKIGVARSTYASSRISKNKVTSYDAVKSRSDLHRYVAYYLDYLSHYPWSSDSDAAKVAEQLRYVSVQSEGRIDNALTDKLMWLGKASVKDRINLRKSLRYFYEQSRPREPLFYVFNSAEKKVLEEWYEAEEKKRVESEAEDKARDRLEAEGYKKADSTGDKLGSGTYYYKNGYKFDVGTDGRMTKIAPNGAKTEYKVGGAEYAKIRDAIRADLSSGTAATTKFPSRRRAAAAEAPTSDNPPEQDTSLVGSGGGTVTEQWWFWPTVGVGTIAVGAGIYFAFLRGR